uniref:Odorant-binding protein n=1 Tax=Sergentomyia schwetzi TaxID=114605 RepID=A0A6B9VME2_9DIPT|nr:hypothetical protein [Sergentomyia schwetzi]
MKFITVFLIFALCAIAYAISPESIQKATEIMAVCAKETGATEEQITKVKTGNLDGADEKTKCLVECFMKKGGVMDDKGNIVGGALDLAKITQLDPTKLTSVFEKCKDETGAGKCETAFKIFKCAFENRGSLL